MFTDKLELFILIIFGVSCCSMKLVQSDESGRLVLKSRDPIDVNEQSEMQYRSYYTATRGKCLGNSECVPLIECTEMMYDAAKSCYTGDRNIFCGITEYEAFVCCPRRSNDGHSVCGKSLVQGTNYRGLGAFPFVARIGFKNINNGNLAYPCTGSIISRRVILTAAHCALAKAEGHRLSSVRVGEYDITQDPDCAGSGFCAPSAINHAISHVIVHPDYLAGQYHNDIALIVLRTPLNYTVAAQPVCLKTDRDGLVIGRRAMIVGWGKVSTSGIRSPQMQYIDIPLTSWESCLRVYGQTGALDSIKSIEGQWMCAGGEGRDACAGFGGAPLVINNNGVYLQIGIMSFGADNCGSVGISSVYTSISYFSKWIEENTPVE